MEVSVENRTNKQRTEYWKKIVTKFRNSNLLASDFSKKNNITAHQLSYWKNKFAKVKPNIETMPFVEIKNSIAEDNKVSLSINDVITINFTNPPSPSWISELINNVNEVA